MAASINDSAGKTSEEVLLITTHGVEDENWNVGVWDALTGNLLQTYRNGSAASNSLCILGGECLVAASHTKPVLHVWSMLKQGQKHRKLPCGGKVSCLSVTPDSNYIAAGIEDKIHIWQVSTGELFNVLLYNSVELACLKFVPSGQYLVSGYKDGAMAVWELQDILYLDPMRVTDPSPVETFYGHADEITDLHITWSNKIASSSLDQTVRLWNLLPKEELKMLSFGAPIASVVMDHSELALYAGDVSGNVYCIDLHHQTADRSFHIGTNESSSDYTCFKAHECAVTQMRLMRDQSKLVIAFSDKTVKIWNMMSSAAPITINLNEKVSNLMVIPTPKALVNPEEKPRILIGSLKRHRHGADGEDTCGDIFLDNPVHQKVQKLCDLSEIAREEHSAMDEVVNNVLDIAKEVESLKQKANKLKKANEEIYNFALTEIMK